MNGHRKASEQVVRELRVGELEVALVVELEKGRRVGVLVLQVDVVDFRLVRGVSALFTHVHLRGRLALRIKQIGQRIFPTYLSASLFVGILMLNTVHLKTMRLKRAPLSERFLAQIALVGSDSRVGSGVSLQVEGVVEALAAERAEVSLDVRVAFHVTVQQALKREVLRADSAAKLAVFFFG